MTAYPEYKATGLQWLPQIPEHWDWLFLSQISEEQKIKNIAAKEKNVLSLSYGNIIRKKNLNGGLTPQDWATYQIVFPGNVILRLTDLQNDHTSLRTGLVKEQGIITSAYTCVKTSHNSAFLHYLLHAYDIQKVFYGFGGGVRQSIGYKALRNLCFPVPSPDEQAQIVRYLDAITAKINKLIRAKKKQIALLQEQKQAIINQAVTQGLDPNVEMKDSGIRFGTHIPTLWTAIPAKYIVNITNGSDPQNTGEIPVYGSGASSFKTCGEFKEGPAVLLGRKGATLNIPHYITGKYWNVDTAFDVKTKNCSYDLRFYFYCATCFDYFFYMSQTTLPSMTQSDYGNMRLPYPPTDEQTDIVEHLDKHCRGINTLIVRCEKEIALAVEYKNSLISAVVTGKMDVRGLAIGDVPPEDMAIDDEEASEEVEEEMTEAESED